jgi:hypothetical protein
MKYSIQKLNNNKAPGPDGLNVELFKIEENKLTGRLWKVIEKIWMEEKNSKTVGRRINMSCL